MNQQNKTKKKCIDRRGMVWDGAAFITHIFLLLSVFLMVDMWKNRVVMRV